MGERGICEAELREGLRDGGKVLGLLVVVRAGSDGNGPEHAIYVRPSWTRGYRIVRTWRDRDDRTFRSLDALFKLSRTFRYDAPVTVYPCGCPELRKFRGVLVEDGGVREPPSDGTDTADTPGIGPAHGVPMG